MPRNKRHPVDAEGWTNWHAPVMEKYRMQCCDCGLVHEVDFKALKHVKDNRDGTWQSKPLDIKKYRVSMRVRRHRRATAAARRGPQKYVKREEETGNG